MGTKDYDKAWDSLEINDIECIITTKVYDSCRQQDCVFFSFIEEEEINIPDYEELEELTAEAAIIPKTISTQNVQIELLSGGLLARVRLDVCTDLELNITNIDTEVTVKNNVEICFSKDVVLYLPDPNKMDAIAEAQFKVMGEPQFQLVEDQDGEKVEVLVPVGAFIIVKSIAQVQLLIPSLGFCKLPPICEEYLDPDACEEFKNLSFPIFYPQHKS